MEQHFTDEQVQHPRSFKQRVKQQPLCDVFPRVKGSRAKHYNTAVEESDDRGGQYETTDKVVECWGGINTNQ